MPDDRVLVRAVGFGRDVFDIVVGAVERGADQLGHRGVDDQQLAPRGGRLVEQHARDEFAALADDRPAKFEMHLAVADPQMVVDDGEQRREVGDRLVFGHVVVDAQTAAHVDETERKAQPFEVLDDDVDLLAHVLEDVQFADLRTDVQVNAHDAQVFQRADPLGVVQNLFVGDAELAVGLTRIDAVVGLGIDVGIDAQGDLHRTSRLGGHRVEHEQLLDRLAVDRP